MVDEVALISLAISGDPQAIADLFELHRPQLTRRLEVKLRLNRSADFSAEDVVQHAFVDVFKGIKSYQLGGEVPFVAWLNRVAYNRLGKFLRERSQLKRGGGRWQVSSSEGSVLRLLGDLTDEDASTISERVSTDEACAQVERCVEALPDMEREAIERFYLQDQTYAEIAEAMRLTKAVVRRRVELGREMLRVLMGGSSRWYGQN